MNNSSAPFTPPDLPLTDFLFQNSQNVEGRTALIDPVQGRSLTYGELLERVHALAAGLYSTGLKPGDVLSMVSANSIDFVLIYLAALAAGAVISPMSSQFTMSEIRTQLIDSRAVHLFAEEQAVTRARDAAAGTGISKIITTLEGDGLLSLQRLSTGTYLPHINIKPDVDLAALPYSSGTTGLPKGVMLTHRNLAANTAQLETVEPCSMDDTFIGLLPFSHIYGLTVVLNLALRCGSTVVIMPSFNKSLLLQSIQDFSITRAHLVPPVLRILSQARDLDQYDLSSLRMIISGAAPLDEHTARECTRIVGCPVKQGYGLTESSPVTHIAPDAPLPIRVASVGLALPGTGCRIIDPASGMDLPAGESGEVLVSGPQIMAGYMNHPSATRGAITEDGWLHTGDVGFTDSEGYLYLVDRIKEMIKVKGYQVAPAEIEAVLLTHPLILDAAVVPIPDPEAGEVPKAFITAAATLSAEMVINHAASLLSPIKRIREVEFVDSIPRSASGKILRRVLREKSQ